jgi:tRNA threonylcarbamoyl adenosine modification protein YeaZ
MATILALDSSIGISSVAIWHTDSIVASLENRESSMQAAKLLPLVEDALKTANLRYSDLTHIACTTGPGSFTGIRIGMAAARGIAFAANLPSLGFTTLEVMAAATGDKNALAILNAGKGEVYFQKFGDAACEPSIGSLADVLARYPHATIASGVPLPAGYSVPAIAYPRADALATLAAQTPENASTLTPLYIRPPDAKPQTTLFRAG